MPRNGSGVYSAPAGGTYPAASGTLIESAKFNTLIADMITALTESVARDGQTVTTANIPMAGFKITGLGNGTAASDAATVYQTLGTPQWCGTAGGTADALTLTPSPALGAYAAGVTFRFQAGAGANTGAATVNVSGLGAIAIQLNGSALAAGDIEASKWYQITLSDATTAQLQKIGFDNIDYLPLAGGTLTGGLTVSTGNLTVSSGNLTVAAGVINEVEGAAVASAATINLDSATGNFLHVTGTTGITAVTLAQGAERTVVFDGALTLTHGASLILPSAANITTAAGDVAVFRGEGAGVTRCVIYSKANGFSVSAETASAKFWLNVDASSGTPSISESYNITSITDIATGQMDVTIATDFSSANYVISCLLYATNKAVSYIPNSAGKTSGQFRVNAFDMSSVNIDPDQYLLSGHGDQ